MSFYFYSPEFRQFAPYVYAGKAGELTEGSALRKHRVWPELSTYTPYVIRRQALGYRAPCCVCGTLMHPFRQRRGEGAIYLNVTCMQEHNSSCSRGPNASHALDLLAKFLKDGDDRPPYEAPRLEGME